MTSLTPDDRALLDAARTATLGTIDPDGRPRLVPICFAVVDASGVPEIWSPIDEKPKRSVDPRSLARVRDVVSRPDVTLLVDHWSEDWTRLRWLRIVGQAVIVEPDATSASVREVIAALRTKYPQYSEHDLEGRPMLRVAIDSVVRWSASN